MPNIYDNLSDTSRLSPALRGSLQEYDRFDVATGYLDLRGWAELADLIDAKAPAGAQADTPQVRVLVGMMAPADSAAMLQDLQKEIQPPPFGSDIHDQSKALRRRAQLVAHLRTQLMRGLATADGKRTLQTLKAQLTSGLVAMKVFTEKPLHGKTYLFHSPSKTHASRWGFLGSSNLTRAGLRSNLELNMDVQDSDATAKLAAWFEDRWSDTFSLDVNAEIIQIIEDSWAASIQPTPFEVYLKVCHALSQDARDGMGYVLPASMRKLLLGYQETAVRTLARRIVRRGGTMLGDVVGLGKTLTAVATALMLEAGEDYTTLVLCPKNLEKMWKEHLERYEVNGRVVPYSIVTKELPELKRFNLVICDESHNLRNNGTVAYQAIQDYIQRNASKVLLLTATPYNLAFQDVANQIGLYISNDEDLGILPATALRKNPLLALKLDGKVTTLAAFRLSEEADDWRRLMSDHLVRRTRSFVKRTAKTETIKQPDGTTIERPYLTFANGTRFYFPTRVPKPLWHSFGENDPARLMEDEQTLDAVKALTLPRYRLADYDDPKRLHTPSDRKILDDVRSGRGQVSGFVRTGMYKRLSSSGHSFILSLQRQRARNELFVYAIDQKLPLPLGTFAERQTAITDEDVDDTADTHGSTKSRYEHLKKSLPVSAKWINSTVFTPELRANLASDNQLISEMLTRFGSWDPARDSKMDALTDLLRGAHAEEKVLIFTEYKDTANYVAAALVEAGIEHVGVATGDTEDPAGIARRFSPVSNALPDDEAPDVNAADRIDVLVATDVLSEGQNLQDSHVVVNYDLPWAIIRVIQRAGRVDRIGQLSDTVNIYLISHQKIEDQIKLRTRIKARLGAAASAFGSDEAFFGGADEIKVLEDFYQGKITDDAETDGEADAVSEAWLTWSDAQEKYPHLTKRALALPDMVYSTRDQYLEEKHGGVTSFVTTISGTEAFATSYDDPAGNTVEDLLTPLEAMRRFRAEPDTPTAEPRPDQFDRQTAIVQGPLSIEAMADGNLRGIRKWAWERLAPTLLSHTAEEALNALHERPLTEQAKNRLTQARRNKYSLEDLAELLNELHGEDRLVIQTSETDEINLVCSIGVTDQ